MRIRNIHLSYDTCNYETGEDVTYDIVAEIEVGYSGDYFTPDEPSEVIFKEIELNGVNVIKAIDPDLASDIEEYIIENYMY